jgi:hypothetical protein
MGNVMTLLPPRFERSVSFDELRTSGSSSAHGDSSTGSELKAGEEACREASRTVEPLNGLNILNKGSAITASDMRDAAREEQANRFILVTEWRAEQPPPNRRNGRTKVRFANATLFVSFLQHLAEIS